MAGNFDWLSEFGPCIRVDGSKVDVLKEPKEFYTTLSERCRRAKNRIVLASLYLGTGELEKDLVRALQDGLAASSGDLKVTILLDACRGSRGNPNSCSLLTPLLDAANKPGHDSVRVSLYRTPHLTGFWQAALPERWNEIVGLQHVKIYLFDDDVIITGANLSHDYFTNRQDRYILFREAKDLADFLSEFVHTVSVFSHGLRKDNSMSPPEIDPSEAGKARAQVESLIDSWRNRTTVCSDSLDTKVWPLVQMGQLGVDRDRKATEALLSYQNAAEIKVATGYFNLTDEYNDCILGNEKTSFDVLMAHPRSNGFFNAPGMSGGVTQAYTLLAHQFFDRINAIGASNRIRLFEYLRPSWTFHAKGLWMYPEPAAAALGPALTLIGSPNFGYRSVHRDLELQLAVVTTNKRLRAQLHQEQAAVFAHATPVTSEVFANPDRYVPYWVRLVIRTMKHFF